MSLVLTSSDSQKLSQPEQTERINAKASSQGLLCMWHGLTAGGLIRMLKHRPEFAWSHASRWASIAAVSMINSLQNAGESLVFGRKIADTNIEHPPIFILGHWRSGTTLLHNLLTLDPQFTFPNLYHCMYPGHFLLTENVVAPLTSWLLPKTRPMDNVPTSWSSPQEDEIALALDCGISPYLMLAFHGRKDVYGRFFDTRDMTVGERASWKKSLLKLMKKLTIRENKSIVLKSPSHTYRIPTLLEMFPNARFIYIYRNPYAVYRSTVHLRQTMFVENSLGPAHLESSEEDTLFYYEKCIRTYEETKSLIPQGNLHEIRFEDLEVDPLSEMADTYKTLDLPGWELVEPKVKEQLAGHESYRKNAFRMDPETMRIVAERLKWVFELYGYSNQLASVKAGRVRNKG